MTDDKLYTSLSANTIMAKVTKHFQRTKLITSSSDKHYSLDSEDDFRSGCRNVSHQQQFFSELHSPRRSPYTNCLLFVRTFAPKIVVQTIFNFVSENVVHMLMVLSLSRRPVVSLSNATKSYHVNEPLVTQLYSHSIQKSFQGKMQASPEKTS